MSIIRFLLIGLMFLLSQSIYSQQKIEPLYRVALGIATPGSGPDFMGHLFIYFGEDKTLLEEGTVYEFNMDRNDSILEEDASPIRRFLGEGHRLYLREYLVGIKTLQYRLENRSVFYYFLDLDQEDILSLKSELSKEKKRREGIALYDYNAFMKSCLTEMLKIINPYLLKNNFPAIEFFNVEEAFSGFKRLVSGELLFANNAPFTLAPKLAKHPAVMDVQKILPQYVQEIELTMAFYRSIESVDKDCSMNSEFIDLMEHLILEDSFLYDEPMFKLFKGIKKRCLKQDSFSNMIFLWYLKADKTKDKIKIENEFSEELG